jgi:hypothetical protein
MNAVYLAGNVFFVTPGEMFAYMSVNQDKEVAAFETNGQKIQPGQDYVVMGRILRSAVVRPTSIVMPPKRISHATLAIFDAIIGLNERRKMTVTLSTTKEPFPTNTFTNGLVFEKPFKATLVCRFVEDNRLLILRGVDQETKRVIQFNRGDPNGKRNNGRQD